MTTGSVHNEAVAELRFPTSHAQQRLWFLDQYEPGTSLYNIRAAWRIDGLLDRDALQTSLSEVVRRHESLRTTFAATDHGPVQIISTHAHFDLLEFDLAGQAQARTKAQRLVQGEADRPFELARGPLFRAALVRLAEGEHILLLTLHHVIADGWSLGVLMRELGVLYRACRQGQASSLAELPIQYADFAVWQRDWLQGDVLQAQLGYWRERLHGAPPLLTLPADRPRAPHPTHSGALVPLDLGPELSTQLHRLSRQTNGTLFMALAAAFNVLLHRYSHQDDICIGYSVANRKRPEIEGLIGFFVNTLVLRTKVEPAQSFESLLGQVRDAVLEADAHQDLPFEKLVEEINPERHLNYAPVFQVMLSLNNTAEREPEWPGLQLLPTPLDSTTSRFDLTLDLTERRGRLCGAFEYNTDLFDRSTVERMAGHFEVLLRAVVINPKARIRDLPLLTRAERHQILVEWNDTRADFPSGKCVQELFEDQVEKSPEEIAVVFEDQQLTYAQLNAKANQLAHYLRESGVRPDTLVAICVERGLLMIIGLLGIMKAGGAYVPLDADHPEERLAFMLDDTSAPILLTQDKLQRQLPRTDARVVCLDTDWPDIARHRSCNPRCVTGPLNVVYCIYTSGSTGRPKGTLNTHGAVVQFLSSMRDQPGITADDVLLAITPTTFDISALEIYLPLLCGARIVCAGRTDVLQVDRLAALIERLGVTILQATPGTWRQLLEIGYDGRLRLALCGGEALPVLVADYLPLIADAAWNLYGPTETTVWSCRARLPDSGTTIGRPISNTQIYVLDEHLEPVPAGVVGRIYIAGAGLARGYLKRPELTAEKFIANPHGSPGSRMYDTGDLGRYLADGRIQFMGRLDHQVKIRGLRIEIGEIECALQAHEAVRDAVVVLRDDDAGDQRLVAYVVTRQAEDSRVDSLLAHLRRRLPAYMVPSAWTFLQALPLNVNGKIDHKRLPAPDSSVRAADVAYVAPTNATQELLAGLWAELLGVERVGLNDNFFALGGHSLMATRLVARISTVMQVNCPVAAIYSNQSLREFSAFVAERGQALQG